MNIFFTADLHFDHEAIRVHCERPFMTLEQMNEALVENWNSVVPKKNSLVYILGDFAWQNHAHWIHKLNGKKILIKGNHDKMNQKCYDLFREVIPMKDIKIEKVKITLCHYGMMSWNCSFHGAWHLYGHSHGRLPHKGLAMDVGVDCNNYTPVSWETIKEKLCAKADKLLFDNNPDDLRAWKRLAPNYGIGLFPYGDDQEPKINVKPAHGTSFVSDSYTVDIKKTDDGRFIHFNGEDYNMEDDFIWNPNRMR